MVGGETHFAEELNSTLDISLFELCYAGLKLDLPGHIIVQNER